MLGLAAALALCPPVLHAQDTEPMAQAPELPVHQDDFVTVQDHLDERVMEFVIGPLDLQAGMPHLRLPIQMAQMPLDSRWTSCTTSTSSIRTSETCSRQSRAASWRRDGRRAPRKCPSSSGIQCNPEIGC
jgi:hypothetical protein